MKLTELKTESFAGLGNKDIRFSNGLHLFFGPNEAGKSTLMSALEIALFADVKYDRRSEKTYRWIERALPLAGGDHYSVTVKGLDGETPVMVKKVFYQPDQRNDNSIHLEYGKEAYESTGAAQDKLKEILGYGERTYRSTVMINQGTLAGTIELLTDTEDDSLTQKLRSARFESEGVSLEKFLQKLKARINEKTGSWKIENNTPATSKRPGRNVGTIATAYWDRLDFEKQKDETESLSERLSSVTEDITEKTGKTGENRTEIEELRKLEKNWRRYEEYNHVKEEHVKVTQVVKKWDEHEKVSQDYDKELEKQQKQIDKIQEKNTQIKDARKYNELNKEYSELNGLQEQIKGVENKLKELPSVEETDIEHLDELSGQIQEIEAKISAQRLIAKVKAESGYEVVAKRGVDGEELKLTGEKEFEARAKLNIDVPDVISIEVRSGNEDIGQLEKERVEKQAEIKAKLDELGIESIGDAKKTLKSRGEYQTNKNGLERDIKNRLQAKGFDNLAELEEKVKEIQDSDNPFVGQPSNALPSEDDIQEEMNKAIQERADYKNKAQGMKDRFEEWKKRYGDFTGAMKEATRLQGRLNELAKNVPDGFNPDEYEFDNPDEIRNEMDTLGKENNVLNDEISNLKTKAREVELKLEGEPLEDIKDKLQEAHQRFESEKKRAMALLEVQDAYEKVRSQMDKGTFKGLEQRYLNYLETLTNGRYGKADDMDGLTPGGFKKTDISTEIPFDVLSTGTKDGAAFSLRLAIAGEVFTPGNDFIIMDEPLINFDSERKKLASQLIREIASEFQIIVFSCDRESREILGEHSDVMELAERV